MALACGALAEGEYARAELHVHTRASDGSMTPLEAVRRAERLGLQVLAVTDHDTFRGGDLALRAARIRGSSLVVVPGNEVRTDHGDVIVLCERPMPGAPHRLWELLDWAGENSCVTIAAHPFHPGRKSLMGATRKALPRLTAIEVWNSRGLPLFNLPAMRLAEATGKPATSGSDAHVPRELGTSPTLLRVEGDLTVEAVLEAIRKGATRPTLGLPGPLTLAEIAAWAIARRLA